MLYTVSSETSPMISVLTSFVRRPFISDTIHVMDDTTRIPMHRLVTTFGFFSMLNISVIPSHPIDTHKSAIHTGSQSLMYDLTGPYWVKFIIAKDLSKSFAPASASITNIDKRNIPKYLNTDFIRLF